MHTNTLKIILIITFYGLVLACCQNAGQASLGIAGLVNPENQDSISQTDDENTLQEPTVIFTEMGKNEPVDRGIPLSPEGLVEQYLNQYIDNLRASLDSSQSGALDGQEFNPFEYFSYEFYTKVTTAQLRLKERGETGFDPVLLTQDLPDSIKIVQTDLDKELAVVTVEQYFIGNQDPYPIQVFLGIRDGSWRIQDILPVEEEVDLSTPSGTVNAFYAWYLHQLRVKGAGMTGLPDMLTKTQLVSPGLVQKVTQVLDGFGDVAGYDPLLCAQDVPPAIWTEAEILNGDSATVLVNSDYPDYYVVVDLEKDHGSWLVEEISCRFKPITTVKAFYTWYLDYIGDSAVEFRNPLVDQAYQDSKFLSADLIQRVDESTGFDPFLMAQDIPRAVEIQLGPEESIVVLREQFGETWQELLITLVDQDGQWVIDDIQRSEQ